MKRAALLRGINLGKRQVRKEALIAAAEACGYTGARTLLASGNLVFEAGDTGPVEIEKALHNAVKAESGIASDVFVRSASELQAVIDANPFPDVARERPNQLVVIFHGEPVPQEALHRVADNYDGPERLHANGRELFIDYPDGQGRSKLDPAMKKLKVKLPVGTARNWNTVLKLAALLAD